TPVPTLTAVRSRFGDDVYLLYFQRPGVEKDFESDLTESLLVNDVGRFACGDVGSNLITTVCRAGHESGLLVVEE
ncbi:MAG TPA: hypothetical protein VFQ48_11540, partial [Pseudonocardiaceae bacterium]|nr:hypothetical protein [Pseudonocardiaceae bacterium]